MKKRTKVPPKVRAAMQKEVHSVCAFCSNEDVKVFETHHIDGNPTNNAQENLILICPTCHAKIEKGEISQNEVYRVKRELQLCIRQIELASVVVDREVCNWLVSDKNEFTFFGSRNNKSAHPVLNLNFINHKSKTIILKKIEVRKKALPRGLAGFGPKTIILKPLAK